MYVTTLRERLGRQLSVKPLWPWLLAGLLAAGTALLLAQLGRVISLILFPYIWMMCAMPDPVAATLFWPVIKLGGLIQSANIRSQVGSGLLLAFGSAHFLAYSLVVGLAARRGWWRPVAAGILIVHVLAASVAGYYCSTRGWPDKAAEGRHAREAGEIYGR